MIYNEWEGLADVIYKEEQHCRAEETAANDRHDTVHSRARTPAKPDKTDGDEKGADNGRGQPVLGLDAAVLVKLGQLDFPHVPDKGWDRNKGADQNTNKGQALLPEAKLIDPAKDEREGLEPDEEQAVHQREIEIQQEDDRLLEVEHERLDHGHARNFAGGHMLKLLVRLGS